MGDLELIHQELDALALSELHQVAEKTGVPFNTLVNLKYRATKNPRINTVAPLATYFRTKATA